MSVRVSEGLAGSVEKDPAFIPRSRLVFPLQEGNMPDLEEDRSMSLYYEIPKSKNVHKSMLLRGVRLKPQTLTGADIEQIKRPARGRSYGGAPLYRGRGGGHRGSFRSDNGPLPPPPPQLPSRYGNQQSHHHNQPLHSPPYSAPPGVSSASGVIPTPSASPYGAWGNWGAVPPPPPGSWGHQPPGGFPQPPPGVREAGSYVGAPPRQYDDRQGGGYRDGGGSGGSGSRGGGRGGNYGRDNHREHNRDQNRDYSRDQNRDRNRDHSRGYDGYGWSGRSY